mmetsp:Transcript_13323/g.23925  ORF Transcript_13323/g.23925 Transcript_13323/m.23925 type:complete len:313 (-) Transcript_13323:30-968(-)|eukprot:CAMPEP_0182443184 /NCGR_PEP_ID=MMETSP1172-20130603/1975_1 /TAXON_ID=708627 /ORGANISM="Timspurckia oligopyrenoides, Strain CCMP3278" /LENGTH=312 /DNA_ID=CAMNT_0024638363 /DNA_START=101 /DNA_END=1039 /DNA_ORIENTATION=+
MSLKDGGTTHEGVSSMPCMRKQKLTFVSPISFCWGSTVVTANLVCAAVTTGSEGEAETAGKVRRAKAYVLDPKLVDIVGQRIATRAVAIRKISDYVRRSQLQVESNRRVFNCDTALKSLFGVDSLMFIQISSCLGPLLSSPTTEADIAEAEKVEIRDMEERKAAKVSKSSRKTRRGGSSGAAAAARESKRGIFAELRLSPPLASVTGSEVMSRPEVTSAIWAYIKRNQLQDPEDKRMILNDSALKAIFNQEPRTSMFAIPKYVSEHVEKISDDESQSNSSEDDGLGENPNGIDLLRQKFNGFARGLNRKFSS